MGNEISARSRGQPVTGHASLSFDSRRSDDLAEALGFLEREALVFLR
jgi:hypothetical protein